MKLKTSITAMIAIALLFNSCKKEEGPVGPKGTDGNANVVLYNFGSQTSSGGAFNYILDSLSQGFVDSSLILVFANPSDQASTAWYPVPGLGSGGAYETRYFIYQTNTNPSTYTLTVRLANPDGSGTYASAVTFDKLKIIFAPASVVISGKKEIDWTNYAEVCSYLKLKL